MGKFTREELWCGGSLFLSSHCKLRHLQKKNYLNLRNFNNLINVKIQTATFSQKYRFRAIFFLWAKERGIFALWAVSFYPTLGCYIFSETNNKQCSDLDFSKVYVAENCSEVQCASAKSPRPHNQKSDSIEIGCFSDLLLFKSWHRGHKQTKWHIHKSRKKKLVPKEAFRVKSGSKEDSKSGAGSLSWKSGWEPIVGFNVGQIRQHIVQVQNHIYKLN